MLMFVSAAVVGCQPSNDANAVAEVVDATPADAPDAIVKQPESTAQSAVDEGPQPDPTLAAQFAPPFPERLELFEPPKRAQSTVRRDDDSGNTVELKGFVNVDQPRVVLSIDGVISPIAEGGEKYGVQVISIQPPNVVLQRGRSRWTATLE
jgi:hypothetical protein